MSEQNSDHAFVHDALAAYLAGGLDAAQRSRFDAHIHSCPDCFDAFTEARDADRMLQRTLGTLVPEGAFEDRLVTHFRENTMPRSFKQVFVRRTAYAAAACVALAATGVFANYAIHQSGRFNNPLSRTLVAQADTADPTFTHHAFGIRALLNPQFQDDKKPLSSEEANGRSRSETSYAFVFDGSDRAKMTTHTDIANKKERRGSDWWNNSVAATDDVGKDYLDNLAKKADTLQSKVESLVDQPVFAIPSSGAGTPAASVDAEIRKDLGREITRSGGNGVEHLMLTPYADLTRSHQDWDDAGLESRGRIGRQTGATPDASRGVQSLLYSDKDEKNARTAMEGIVEERKNLAIGRPPSDLPAINDSNIFVGGTTVTAGVLTSSSNPTSSPDALGSHGSYDVIKVPVTTDDISKENSPGKAEADKLGAFKQSTSSRTGVPDSVTGNESLDERLATTEAAQGKYSRSASATQPAVTVPIAAQSAPGQAPAPTQGALKIIRNGTVEFEVRSFDDTYLTVSTVVTEERGFVSSTTSEKLANGKVRGSIVIRVPPENLDRFLLKIRALGDLKAQQIGASDVTKQYTDIESELRGLRTMESRLIDLIKNGKGEVKDLVVAEKQLGDYRIRIETLEGQIRYYNNLVGMATLTITAYEKDIQKPTAASEQEMVNLSVETEEVETKYQTARKILDDARARIVESQLRNTDADHVAATITADVPPEKSDFVAAQLKQLGRIATFNRDRRQTTTGGPGAPLPDVKVEQKDTRFSISLFNLANLAPRETTVMNVAVRDVEASYKKIQALLRTEAKAGPDAAAAVDVSPDAKTAHPTGRIINSALNGQVAEQMTADIRAEIRAEQADAVIQVIRDSGEVITSTMSENPDAASATAAKRGVQLRLINIAAIPPKETAVMNVAVRDVEVAQKKILALLDKPVDAAAARPAAGTRPDTTGRVITSAVNGQQPEQMTADLRAEIRADQADAFLQAVRESGEVLTSSSTQNPDAVNFTASKRGLQLRLINVASVAARETQTLRIVAADVPDAYKKLLASLQALATQGNARVMASTLSQSDPGKINATLSFEARRESLPTVEKAFADAGIDFFSRNIARSTNTASTLDTKVLFQIEALISAESLDPRRTIIQGIEVDNVDKAMETIRSFVSGTPVREIDFNASKAPNGRVIEVITLDSPVGNTLSLLTRIRDLGGTERENQITKNPQVPDTKFSKDRVQLTLVSRDAIVQSDKGLSPTVRAALSSAAGALLYSVYLVVTGILFIAPFAIIAWILWRIFHRRKPVARS